MIYYQEFPPPISPFGSLPIHVVRPGHKTESILGPFSPLRRSSALSQVVVVIVMIVDGDDRHCVIMPLLDLFASGITIASRC